MEWAHENKLVNPITPDRNLQPLDSSLNIPTPVLLGTVYWQVRDLVIYCMRISWNHESQKHLVMEWLPDSRQESDKNT